MERTVLAIDPGNIQSAFILWNGSRILDFGILENEQLLNKITELIVSKSHYTQKLEIVIEMIAHYGTGMPAGSTVFDTCIWIGRIQEHCLKQQEEVKFLKRMQIKMHICGQPRAKDPNIRQALVDRFGLPGTKNNPGLTYGLSKDVWQAFAVAVTYFDTTQEEQ